MQQKHKIVSLTMFYLKTLLLIFLSGCISDVTLTGNEDEPGLVLNGILTPSEDTVWVYLSWTKPVQSANTFSYETEAQVRLFEDGKSVGELSFSDSSTYILPYRVTPGKTYRIEAEAGRVNIWAETSVPRKLDATIDKLPSSTEGYQLTFSDNSNEDNFYWVGATRYEKLLDTTRLDTTVFYLKKDIAFAILTDFEYADDFNRYINNQGNYKFEYEYYIRFSDAQLAGKEVRVKFRPMGGSSPEVFLLSADYHLDKYMKSSLLLERMELYAEDMPVIFSPQTIYTNIHGGTGIFGSYYGVSKEFN